MSSRRFVLKSMGAGLLAASQVASASTTAPVAASLAAAFGGEEPPWWLIAPLQRGASVGHGWELADLSAVRDGVAILTLHHASHGTTTVHICARSGRAKGVGSSALFDLLVMDGRQGSAPTREDVGRVVLNLARHIRRNEMASNDAHIRSIAALAPHHEPETAEWVPTRPC